MFGPKISVSKALYDRLKVVADVKGYSSADEFAVHVLEEAVKHLDDPASEAEVKKRLQGLGYME